MDEKFELDSELKALALDWAEKIYNNIYVALSDPTHGMTPDTVKIYNEMKAWGWFDVVPMDSDKSHEITIKFIAMSRYKQLMQNKTNPPMSKWERVMGKGLRR